MELKPGYKHTEAGLIPEDWQTPLLDDVALRGSGHTPDKAHPEYWNGNIKWISLKDSDRLDRLYIKETAATITAQGIANSSAKLHPAGTVVLSRDAGVGKSSIMRESMAVSQHFMAWTCGSSLSNRYLYYWLQLAKPEFERIAMGNTIKTIGLPYFKKLRISLPPTKTEQEAIAEALRNADALIESLEQLLAKKRHLKHGAMQELLTGKKRLPGFSRGWSLVTMRDTLTQNATYGVVTAGRFVHDGVKMLRSGDIIEGRINTELPMISHQKAAEYSRTTLMKDDVVIALVGYPGASAMIPDALIGANISRAVGLLRLKGKFIANYLVHFLNSPNGRRMVLAPSAGSAQKVVNLAALNKLEFYMPETDEQITIATTLDHMDAEIAGLETRLAKILHIKEGMMQELLTGRIRLL